MPVYAREIASFGALHLFSDRIVHRGSTHFASALLSQVDFCRTVFMAKPILLILGILAILGGGGMRYSNPHSDLGLLGLGVAAVGVLLVVAFALTRRNILSVRAGAGIMLEAVRGKSLADAAAFIEAVERAKIAFDHPAPPAESVADQTEG